MKPKTLFRRSQRPVFRVLFGALILALLALATAPGAFAAGFGTDDRLPRSRDKGTVYGAIGLVVHSDGLELEAGTGFLVSPCHIMTAYHVVAGKRKLTTADTAGFYVGEGKEGPDYPGGKRYAESTTAHPVVWGDFFDGESDQVSVRVKAARSNGWNDWVLLKLDRCLGDPATGYGYLHLDPASTRDLTRSGQTPDVIAVGLPKDKDDKALTEDPDCRIVGQMSESGWQHDCLIIPGNSGGPLLERKSAKPGQPPRVLGIAVSLVLLDGMDQDQAEMAVLSADDPSYFNLLSTAVPVSSFINFVAPYLPADPTVEAYVAAHHHDTGYKEGEEIGYDRAIADLGQAVKARPEDPELLVRRGLWLSADNQTDAAIDAFTAALKLRSDYPAALLSRSQSLSDRDDNSKHDLDVAIGDLTALLRRFPGSAELQLNRGYVLFRDRRFDAAIGDFSAVLKTRPQSSGALQARASAYSELKQFDLAAKDYDQAISLEAELPGPYVARGNFRSQLGQDAEALADFERAIQIYPSAADAYSGRAYVLLQQGKAKEAVRSFDQALQINDKASYVLGGRGSAYQILGDHDSAIRDYAEAVALDPGEPFIQLLYFVEQARAGKTDAAKQNFATFAADARFDDWPRTLARFFAGEIGAPVIEKMVAAGETDYERSARAFDRDFYLGQAALIAGNNGDAVKHLSAVLATGDRQYIEYNIAAADIARLKAIAQTGNPAGSTLQN